MIRAGVQLVAAAAVLLTLAGAAGATSLGYLELKYSSCGPTEAASTYVDGAWTGPWYCGQYNLQLVTTPGTYSAGYATDLVNQSNNGFVGSFCMDIRQEAPPAYAPYQIYKLGDAPIGGTNSPGGMGAQKADDLRRLFNLWSSSFNDSQAAAFQAAVWEIENEKAGTPYDVYTGDLRINEYWGGSFTLNGVTYTNWGDYANRALLANLGNVSPNEDVVALVSSDFQDYALTIRGSGGQEVPEPVTLAGVILGIGGLAGYVRRRRAMA